MSAMVISSQGDQELVSLFGIWLTRIVTRIRVFDAQRTNGGYLGDVLTGLCPVEVGRIAGHNDNATGRVCFAYRRECLCGISFTPDGTLTLIV
jgi:hypothetical protein